MLSTLTNQMQHLNEQAHNFAFSLIFHPLEKKLECVPGLQAGPLLSLVKCAHVVHCV